MEASFKTEVLGRGAFIVKEIVVVMVFAKTQRNLQTIHELVSNAVSISET